MKSHRRVHFEGLEVITPRQIPRVDFHLHTTWTDGTNSLEEMHDRSLQCGLSKVLFSEHVRKTSGDWFPEFARQTRALPTAGCRALVGAETKAVDFAGTLDCTAAIIAEADLIMASVHRFPGERGTVRGFGDVDPAEAEDLEFRLASAILQNPDVDILGHPFGMCYRRFHVRPSPARMRTLIELAARTGVAVEINAHYHPDPWLLIGWCREAGATVSLGSNAHSIDEVGRVTRILDGREEPWCPSGF